MSIPLIKILIKKNWLLFIIILSVLTMYTMVMISMYSPNEMEALTSMMQLFSDEMLRAFGFTNIATDLTGFIASWLYGMMMFAFPMVYCIILGNKLVAKMVDNGSMAYLLSTPNSRVKIIITQGAYGLTCVAVMFAALFGIGVLTSNAMFPNELDVAAYFRLNGITMLVNMFVMMITFFFSCLFNDSKYSVGFGAGIPVLFLLMNMLGGASKEAEILKRISIYGLYDPVEVTQGSDILGLCLLFGCGIIILFITSVIVFKKKRLPL